jgi:hypothetical protein
MPARRRARVVEDRSLLHDRSSLEWRPKMRFTILDRDHNLGALPSPTKRFPMARQRTRRTYITRSNACRKKQPTAAASAGADLASLSTLAEHLAASRPSVQGTDSCAPLQESLLVQPAQGSGADRHSMTTSRRRRRHASGRPSESNRHDLHPSSDPQASFSTAAHEAYDPGAHTQGTVFSPAWQELGTS